MEIQEARRSSCIVALESEELVSLNDANKFESKINEKFSSTGTFITVDISVARLEAEGKVDIRGTVEKLRNQRAYSVQAINQYSYCHRALIDYAIEEKFLESYKNFEDIFERNSSNVSYLTFFISS